MDPRVQNYTEALEAAVRSLAGITGEEDPERLLSATLQTALRSAGAQAGALLVQGEAAWLVAARAQAGSVEAVVPPAAPCEVDRIAPALLEIAARAREPVVRAGGADAQAPTPDLERNAVPGCRSVVCAPLVRAGRVLGLAYLRSDLPDVFTPHRMGLLEVVLGHAAVALDAAWSRRARDEGAATLRRIVDTALEGIWVLGPDGKTTFANARMAEMLGCRVDDLVGRSPDAFLFEEDLPDHRERLEARRRGAPENYERRLRRRDGATLWIAMAASPIFADGEFRGSVGRCSDVTERRRAEQEVALLTMALDRVHEGAFLIDRDARFRYVNEEACRSLGYTRAELLARGVPDIDPDYAQERWPATWEELRRRGTLRVESRHRTRDGRVLPVEIGANYFEHAGEGHILSLVRDITERKQAEQERAEHLALLQSMDRVNRAIQGAGDLEQMMGDVLEVVLDVLGCDRAWLLYPCDAAGPWSIPMERVRPEYAGDPDPALPSADRMAGFVRALEAAGGPLALGAGDLPAPLAAAHQVRSVLATILRPKVGKPYVFGVHACASARDWSLQEQRLTQEIGRRLEVALSVLLVQRDLQESERRLEQAQRFAHVGHWERDLDAGVMTLSDEARRIFGLPPGERVLDLAAWHERWLRLLHPEDRELVNRAYAEALAGEGRYDVEYRVIRPNGEARVVHSVAEVLRDAAGRPQRVFGTMHDVTERRSAEDETRRLNRELERRVAERTAQLEAANQELQAFAYSVSHDLRAPLRHVSGFVQLLRRHLGPALDERGLQYVENASSAVARMGTLIDDLLSFSRMGRQQMSRMEVDLGTLAREAVAELEPEARGRTVRWRLGALPVVAGDRAMLRLVLLNLLSNALKFTRPRAEAEIEVSAARGPAGEHVIAVRDNGVGFEMAYAGRLFDVFQRLHRTEEFEGVGIGLANVRRVVARHGGRTWAEGRPGDGATFSFSLPA